MSRIRATYRATIAPISSWEVNAFVEATPISGPDVLEDAAVGLAGDRGADGHC